MQATYFLLTFSGVVFGGVVATVVHALHPNGARRALANLSAVTISHTHRLLLQMEEMTGELAAALRRREGASHNRQRTEVLSKLGELLAFCDPDAFLRGKVAPWNLYARSFDDALQTLKAMATGDPATDLAILSFANEMSAKSILNAVVAAAA